MPAYAALLRAVNVGGRSVAMAELRTLLDDLGFADVGTYVQSGNAVFRSSSTNERMLRSKIERAVRERFGIEVPVMLRSHAELAKVQRANPYARGEPDPSRLLVMFLDVAPKVAAARALDGNAYAPDVFTVKGREIYLHVPNGFGHSLLTVAFFERKLGVQATARNWRTVGKLLELTG